MSPTDDDPQARVVEILAAHQFRSDMPGIGLGCYGCDWTTPWDQPLHECWDRHRVHLAAVLAEAGLLLHPNTPFELRDVGKALEDVMKARRQAEDERDAARAELAEAKAERAEAALDRVRALADEWAGDPVGGDLWRADAVDALRVALDEELMGNQSDTDSRDAE